MGIRVGGRPGRIEARFPAWLALGCGLLALLMLFGGTYVFGFFAFYLGIVLAVMAIGFAVLPRGGSPVPGPVGQGSGGAVAPVAEERTAVRIVAVALGVSVIVAVVALLAMIFLALILFSQMDT